MVDMCVHSDVRFNQSLIEFMCNLNTLHIFTSILIYVKMGFLYSVPSCLLTVTSYLYWTHPTEGVIKTADELVAHMNVVYHVYNSMQNGNELCVIVIVYVMILLNAYSNYYIKLGEKEKSIYSHSVVVVLGNIAAIIVYYNK